MTAEVVAQGIAKTVAVAKQTGKGVPADVTAPGQYLRRITYVAMAERDTFDNNEIVTHQQSTGISYGLKKVSAKLSGLLSSGSYSLFFASVLRKLFVAGSTTGAITTVASASTTGAQGTFTRNAGSYLTDGFKVGDIVRSSGWATTGASNNNVNLLVLALSATVMTVIRFDGGVIGAKAAGDSVTIAVVGKKTLAPLTGHTNEYLTMEDFYPEIPKSEMFTDMKPNQIDVAIPATGNATFGLDFVGLLRTRPDAQVMSNATAPTNTAVLTALNGLIFANGAPLANVTSLKLTITGNVKQGDATIGSDVVYDLSRGRIAVTGEFVALFSDDTIQDIYDAETPISLVGIAMDNKLVGTSDFVAFSMGRIKITGDTPDDGEKLISRTYPFTAEININGGVASTFDQTIVTVQDSQA